MKIDEACINHTALRVINEIVGIPYEYGDQDESADHCRLMTLGEVRGVIEMAEAMKKVLKGEERRRGMREKIIDLLYAENVRSDCGIERLADEICAIDPARWIPVSDRLPKEGVQVLVTDDAGGLATIDVDCGYFDEEYGRFEWFHSQNVTAWMPLPEPYAERREGNG